MSRFQSLAHAIWHCTYHIVWVPKYRFRILKGDAKEEVEQIAKVLSQQLEYAIIEMNVQEDHVHIVVIIPPKISESKYVGIVKGKIAILQKYYDGALAIKIKIPDISIRNSTRQSYLLFYALLKLLHTPVI